MPDSYTCISCRVLFQTPELQREHFKSDWHRYNLKRKVAGIPPSTLVQFELKTKQYKLRHEHINDEFEYLCEVCSKVFNSRNAYYNHENSKKHKILFAKHKEEEQQSSDTDSFEKVEAEQPAEGNKPEVNKFVLLNADDNEDEDIETDSEIEEVRISNYFIVDVVTIISKNLICNITQHYVGTLFLINL